MIKKIVLALLVSTGLMAQSKDPNYDAKFEQLGTQLPTPNTYRTASGAPGHQYWQQKVNYDIKVEINDKDQSITASELITYINNSPDELTYLWLQLDQNGFAKESDSYKINEKKVNERMTVEEVQRNLPPTFEGGYQIKAVKDKAGAPLKYVINKTMMRVDLSKPLKSGASFEFSVDWLNYINDNKTLGGRGGYEFFEADGNYLYEIAQWFPRLCTYTDDEGWQNKQFLGSGEFALPFGDYKVAITVPADHIVGATGVLQNMNEVLSVTQRERYEKAKKAEKPVEIVTQKEAEKSEKGKAEGKKTWIFKAQNVRDFAFASSRKFIWDAKGVDINGNKVMAMSFYPKEGNPLWGKYSTEVVAHTLKSYSKFTIDYPYPVAISVHGPVWGMEYPMISFNGGRPEPDGTYSEGIKYAMISVIIHEVGHNFFPMIINSDERQWTWMDEGLNTFVQFLAEQEWDRNYPSRRGAPKYIVPYMKSELNTLRPIMTNSEQILQFGNNAYGKPATALNILRETIMGRELFDYAFKEYCRRWAFKHPSPADFFRTMEDASAVDLDWFWKGWFYTVDKVDISIESVKWFQIEAKDPVVKNQRKKKEKEQESKNLSKMRNETDIKKTVVEANPDLLDFYNSYDAFQVTPKLEKEYREVMTTFTEKEKALLNSSYNFYEVTFKNIGGLVMPLIVEFTYKDGSKETERIPAEIWRLNEKEVTKLFVKDKEIQSIVLDPLLETADCDLTNNHYPREQLPTRFEIYKRKNMPNPNPMQESK
jgi:hypothetical protein